MSNIINMEIEIIDNPINTASLISSSLALNWSRENANLESNINQVAFRYTNNNNDITVWFTERNGVLITSNVVARHTRELPIEECNNTIRLFAEQNLEGRFRYSIV